MVEGKNATRDGQLARSHELLQRLRHRKKDGGAKRGGKLRASAHALSGQVLRQKTGRRLLPVGLRRDQDDHLLQPCPARGPAWRRDRG